MIDFLIAKVGGNKLHLILEKPENILWINEGIYALIPIELVKNELSIRQDRAKLGYDHICTFTWDQAIIIPPETGKVLAGEQK